VNGVRLDKWLWAARFFKTRSLAARACELGRVESHNQPVKPARDIKIGDMLKVTTEGGIFEVEVLALSEMRGPAAVAQTLYRETETGKEARLQAAADRKAMMQFAPAPEGRPSKKDRRKIRQFRQSSHG
jgi:ribosome-associated heat shock protein Hsp15